MPLASDSRSFRRRKLRVARSIEEEIAFDVELKEIDIAPTAGPAALGLPALKQRNLPAGDIVHIVGLLIVDKDLVPIFRLSSAEDIRIRLNDMTHTVNIKKLRLGIVIDLPERR